MTDASKTADLTAEQLELARHALGLPNNLMRSYRNRFLAAPPLEGVWREMVCRGLATVGSSTSTGTWFSLSRQGASAALLPAETLDLEDFE